MMATTLVACSTTGLDNKATTMDWSKGSIVLMTVSMTNEYRPSYPPTRLGVVLGKRTDPRFRALMSSPVQAGTNIALMNQQLPAGYYTIEVITGQAASFPIFGAIRFNVDAPFVVPPRSVAYLGHLELVNKEKTSSDDQATGDALPLLDQAVSGFSGGTLEVSLQDNFDQDIVQLRKEYPALQGVNVVRAPLRKVSVARATGSNSPAIVRRAPSGGEDKSDSISVEDVEAVPNLSYRGKAAYKLWLGKPNPKAFVLGPGSAFAYAWGGANRDAKSSQEDPLDKALARCKSNTGVDCKPYAINDSVVWIFNAN